ncbi:Alpha-ketoglutarate-dependent dioxygenase alkB 7, mitochondrial [Actinomortierella ambigua]|uniref:Alpha-ketoglutarate-dependent dioxygenase alkB 7, mitochondrial n=1 Tax=Actinomortierella ambigua TaxID=1343610 RepID=A0A9P6PSQ3_9FUNG|nr:Alpha-ketoglutarate-dependent dioxygenase alkB 7, mitochondrial [Actinomortierella ambigua]
MLRSLATRCFPHQLQAPSSLSCHQPRLLTALRHTWSPLPRNTLDARIAPTLLSTPSSRPFSTAHPSHQQQQHQQPRHEQDPTQQQPSPSTYTNLSTSASVAADHYDLTHIPSEAERAQILRDFILVPNYLSETEQTMLFDAATKKLKRALGKQVRYEDGHFDGVITRYRECSATDWGGVASAPAPASAEPGQGEGHERSTPAEIICDIKHNFFPHHWRWVAPHILELEAGRGGIKPHVDHLDASGEVVAGLCLGSTAVMELIHEADPSKFFRVLLPKGCFYFQRDSVRYHYKHGIPIELEDHSFRGKVFPKDRRISILLRNVNEKKTQ